ncbi:MAG: hypothetical protein AB2A00_37885 [Myxococcota bacterium]
MIDEVRHRALVESGALKMRASALLAEGRAEDRFEAAVLFHEAARAEKRALSATENPSATERLARWGEACGCLISGLDPPQAARAWGEVLNVAASLRPRTATATLNRLREAFLRQNAAFVATLRDAPLLQDEATLVPAEDKVRRQVLKQIDGLLELFPGVAHLWWLRFRNQKQAGDLHGGWESLRKAQLLAPDNPSFAAIALWLAPQVLSRRDAEARLDAAYDQVATASAEVCLFIALGKLKAAAETRRDREALHAALRAASVGLSRSGTYPALRASLYAVQLASEVMLGGGTPNAEVLYRAGVAGDFVGAGLPVTDVLGTIAAVGERSIERLAA